MKKKFFGGLAVLTIAVVAAFNVNMQEKGLSDISLDNVEALASEFGAGSKDCYYDIEYTGSDGDKIKSCKSPLKSCRTFVSGYRKTSQWLCS